MISACYRTVYSCLAALLFLVSGCASLQTVQTAGTEQPAEMQASSEPNANAPAEETGIEEGDDEGEELTTAPEPVSANRGASEAEQAAQVALDAALELTEAAQDLWSRGESEKAIEALDQAYLLMANTSAVSSPKLVQQKEDLRLMVSKRVTEVYASRVTRANGTHQEIPLAVNDHVRREIHQFQTVERTFFEESYRRSGMYRGEMVKAFKDAGLPEELSWLPLIESGFKAKALSRARALGLWQFIPSTGYKFGLRRNDWVDERLHPEKSTQAAIAYLRELHQIFGDWATVLAAYNCGEGNVLRVIRDQKINYLDNFWDLYERLPRETARYYPRFLASLAIIRDPAAYGFTLDETDAPLSYETVTVERQMQLAKIGEAIGETEEALGRLNAELRRNATPPTPYEIKVPAGKGEALLAAVNTIPKYTPPKVEYVVHRVRRGETLSLIAMRYRTSVQRIVEANHLRSAKYLRVGQKLKIPARGGVMAS